MHNSTAKIWCRRNRERQSPSAHQSEKSFILLRLLSRRKRHDSYSLCYVRVLDSLPLPLLQTKKKPGRLMLSVHSGGSTLIGNSVQEQWQILHTVRPQPLGYVLRKKSIDMSWDTKVKGRGYVNGRKWESKGFLSCSIRGQRYFIVLKYIWQIDSCYFSCS